MTNAYKNYKEVELRSIVILVFGTLLFLVPIVGWILGPVCWIMGVVTLLSPVHGHRLLTWMFENKKYGEIASQVLRSIVGDSDHLFAVHPYLHAPRRYA
jgi:hypothetical protein